MANEGCFFDLNPMAEAKLLNFRPEGGLEGVCRGDFSLEYDLPRSFPAAELGGLADKAHHVPTEVSWREDIAEDIEYLDGNERRVV